MKKIVVVDDEKDMLELVRYRLEKEGWSVLTAASGEKGLELVKREAPQAVVLDIMMPGLDGLEVLRRLRSEPKTAHLPVLLLTARGEEADRIVGLELGADDYVVKPFSPRELVARLKAILRRTERQEEAPLVIAAGPIRLDASRREVTVKDALVPLTTTEFDLLRLLVSKPGRAFTRSELIDRARGSDAVVTDRVIDAHVASIRRKLGTEAAEWLETVRGYGYRFRDQP